MHTWECCSYCKSGGLVADPDDLKPLEAYSDAGGYSDTICDISIYTFDVHVCGRNVEVDIIVSYEGSQV